MTRRRILIELPTWDREDRRIAKWLQATPIDAPIIINKQHPAQSQLVPRKEDQSGAA